MNEKEVTNKMDKDSKILEERKLFIDTQQSEANLHWSRNNYFLMCSSILLLALSQFKTQLYQLLVAILGFVLNSAWLAIQDRSSNYIQYYKTKEQELAKAGNVSSIYPKIHGIEMRIVVYILPVIFILIWFIILIEIAKKYLLDV